VKMKEPNHTPRRCAPPLSIEGNQASEADAVRAAPAASAFPSIQRGARQGGVCSFFAVFAATFIALTSLNAAEVPRGGRVGWGRLITESSSWSVHAGNDPILAAFIRSETSLNIDPTCYPVDPQELEKLCAYPFVFTNNLTNVHDPQRLDNLREYLKRGGFIYIDRCVNLSYSLEQEPFYARHLELFSRFLPGSEVREIPEDHPIYRCYFNMPASKIHGPRIGHNRIYGVYFDGRMVALLSLANFQCGWPNSSNRRANDLQMIANIYVYTMTRSEEK
jgi:Domain of unknown function (DUF4159)